MKDVLEELRKRVTNAPTEPGVYRWINAKGEVLYIGKAKNLRSRLKSYVQKEADKSLGPWKISLRNHIADFDVTVTTTELEALILETNLIKESKPKYNVLMKDDKNYVYVRISNDAYPEFSVVRQMEDDDARYFGPYLSAYNIKRTLNALHEVFHFRACPLSTNALNGGNTPPRACLEYQIGQCNGLCVGDVNQQQYVEAINHVIRFLKGDHTDAIHALKDMMDAAAHEKKFEKAAKLRDTLKYIASLGIRQTVSDTSRENTDAIGIALQSGKAQVVVLRERNGRLVEERNIAIAGEKDLIPAVICELIPQYYSAETDIPDLILIQEDIPDKDILEAWLKEIRGKKTEIRAPERGKKSKLLSLAESNAKQKISQQFAKWEAAAQNIEIALTELKNTLNIEHDLKRIEGYDISHLGGTETVGSMVVMKNGKPANKDYRSFTIRTVKEGEIDDYKALKEVLGRRLRYLLDNKKQWEEKGVTVRKARKADQKDIVESRRLRDLPTDDDAYKETIVATKEDVMIGMARLQEHTKGVYEIRSVWIDASMRGKKLGHTLVRTILKKNLKGKVYVAVEAELEEYYAQIGFRYVHQVPDAMRNAMEARYDGPLTYMLYDDTTHKTDMSLTSAPDLLVIDGGKGQLSAIVEVLKELDLDIPVIGLAKREEEVFVPGESLPIDLPNNSEASFLLQRLRNEAHRFANAHREKRIAKGLIGSALDSIPGIGIKTKKELLQRFGSVDNIKQASDEDLLTVLNAKQLEDLRKHP